MAEELKWLEITLETNAQELDTLTARLTGNGVTGLVIEDEADFQRFLEENRQYWDYVDEELQAQMRGACRVKFYVTDDADGEAQRKAWLSGIDTPWTAASLGDNDWAHSWQKYYKPMAVGERLYIVPEWERGGRPRRQGPPLPEPRPHLRHGEPRLHPALSGGGGAVRRPRRGRAGPGLRQRHSLHRGPGLGRRRRRGRGHRPQGGGRGL